MFFDTYALMEIIKGNAEYEKIIRGGVRIITTRMNLMEMHYNILKNGDKIKADFYYEWFLKYTVDINDIAIKSASEFRSLNIKKQFSYVDCLGFTLALMHGMKFLTGDNAFKGMDGVEFVK